mmetsp:Transcript_33389/g.62833  ORF Transcript_33389/g.62833 Transcript_33389/m.62833 type:complete len:130 (+) Transcript_33389:211-600(+)
MAALKRPAARKISCMGCYSFFNAREGAMCNKSWREFCSQECLDKYNSPGTVQQASHLKYAQSLLKSVETRPEATGGVPTGALRTSRACAHASCSKQIVSLVSAVGVACNGRGTLFYCSKACVAAAGQES